MCEICTSKAAMEALSDGEGLPGDIGMTGFMRASIAESGDASANAGTNAAISIGDTFEGNISTSLDVDWIAIDLVAGQEYVFTIWGTGGAGAGISDTSLELFDGSGHSVGYSADVSSFNDFSQISYTASSTGTYYIAAGSQYGAFGDYVVQASTNVFTVEQIATQMTDFGWGVNTTLQHDEKTGDTMTVNLTGLTADGQKLARWALEAWEQVTGLTFSETTSFAADIMFDDDQSGAFAGPDSYYTATGNILQASVNVSVDWIDRYGTTLDSYSFLTYMHEIGHALGLMHSGNYNGSATYGVDNHYLNDSYQMSIMSYFSNAENTSVNASNYLPATPMIADIYAVQSLYGTPTNVNSGDTIWGANSNVGGYMGLLSGYLFDGVAYDPTIYNGGAVGMTIYDSGGTDLIDLSTQTANQRVDLRAGSINNVGGMTGNLVIGLGTVIENLTSGSGHDYLFGNSADNIIIAGAGNDTLFGANGDDDIEGGAGSDFLRGGGQRDLLDGGLGADTLFGDRGNDTLLGHDGNDELYGGYQNDLMAGENGNDLLNGELGADSMNGGAGDDRMFGGYQDDVISGGTGNDMARGGGDNDEINGDSGMDTLFGDRGNDTLHGGDDNDNLYGGFGDDDLNGDAGDDLLNGELGDDTLDGGAGNDTLLGGYQDDVLTGDLGNDSLRGGGDNDTLNGGAGNDQVHGDLGHDLLFGDAGSDTMTGGGGNDTLNGGAGDDTIVGGAGNDVFVFEDGHGDDVILGFAATNDAERLDLSGITAITDLTDLMDNHAQQVGGAVVIDTGDGNSIRLASVQLSDLDAADFLF